MSAPRVPPALSPSAAWLLWNAAERHPEAPAIVERERRTTYAALRARAAAIAGALRGGGLLAGDRVGVLAERGADAAAAWFGVVAAGGIAVTINETLRPRQIEHILRHADAQVLLSTSALLGRLPRPLATDSRITDLASLPAAGAFEPAARVGGDVAHLIYTSGSTGLPKGVVISHANIWAGATAVATYLALGSDERIASLLPFSFDYGFNQLLCALLTGSTLVVERSPVPQQIAATLRAENVTVLPCVPPLWLQLLSAPDFAEPLPALRVLTNTGGRLPEHAVRALRRLHPEARLFLMYGLTEAFRATYLPPEEVDRRPESIGRAIPGCEILVLDPDGRPAAPGEPGELVQRGATVALGYWRDPEATARVFRPHPLRPPGTPDAERVVYSGDLVRADADGFLYFVGRQDAMIKSLGYRVSPDELTEVLYASGLVREAAVVAEPDEQRGSLIVAHVALADGAALESLERHCKVELPRYMQPARLRAWDTLPRTPSGKFDLQALGAP